MIWYLLSPARGTTQPPTLSSDHPIRRAFYRHGKVTAHHWMLAMLASVGIAVIFCYPTVFLSENPTAGLTTRPHQVWTTAKNFDGNSDIQADVEMRQVWVHGSYMKALEKDVLLRALEIQQSLVGTEKLSSVFEPLGTKSEDSSLSWGYHSPLMYWNNSAWAIDNDEDVLRTINDQVRSSSSLNVALRPASVFAGKSFDRRKLQAADALVLTMMNKAGDGVATHWHDQMQVLSSTCDNCTLFPSDGHVQRSRVYEFGFVPLSFRENVALAFAYGCVALYVLLSLRRLRAFHSRFGLVVTAITQLTTSILSSFTICGLLNINLASIPQNAYPFVVMVLGLENMFRLINAVLAYPPTMATDVRIGNALGDVGPLKMATAGQNLLILWILSRLVSPGVAAFCAFAAIATLFDTFFLLTFFVAVLNVDIRRLELQDALARSNQGPKKRRKSPVKHSWFDALVSGRLPFSTRMAGTVVTTTFILSLNYHFFEHKEKLTSLRHMLKLFTVGQPGIANLDTFATLPMNVTLTPNEWLKMQDFDTAREVMRLVKPGSNSFIIRAFSPLIVILAGADRTGVPVGSAAWENALRSFALHHLYPFAVAVVFVVTFVAVLMNFLLWNEASDEADALGMERAGDVAVAVQTLSLPHKLDVVKLFGSNNGQVLSIGLDRTVAMSTFDSGRAGYSTTNLPPELTTSLLWPVHDVALDDTGNWIAFVCANDSLTLYSRTSGAVLHPQLALPDDHPVLLLEFARLACEGTLKTHLIIVTAGGRHMTLSPESGRVAAGPLWHRNNEIAADQNLVHASFVGAGLVKSRNDKRLIAVTNEAFIVSLDFDGKQWVHGQERRPLSPTVSSNMDGKATVHDWSSETGVELFGVTFPEAAVIMSSSTLSSSSTIVLPERLNGPGRMILGPVAACPSCGAAAVTSLAIASEGGGDDECRLTVVVPGSNEHNTICLKSSRPECHTLDAAKARTLSLPNAGNWKDLASQAILGLRKRRTQGAVRGANGYSTSSAQVRNRRRNRSATQSSDGEDVWEAYRFSMDGELEIVDASKAEEEEDGMQATLLVNEAGPVVSVDAQAVAVAFGNSLKVVRSSRRGSVTRTAKSSTSERSSLDTRRSH